MRYFLFIITLLSNNADGQVLPQGFFVSAGIEAVQIGAQIWMRNNLNTVVYNNGQPIPYQNNFNSLTTGAYGDYNAVPSNSNTYGRLYNWYAVTDARGICPVGWRVPSETDFIRLTNYLYSGIAGSGVSIKAAAAVGGKLKEIGTIESGTGRWADPNTNATDYYNFRAIPSGWKQGVAYAGMGTHTSFWTTTTYVDGLGVTDPTAAFRFTLYYNQSDFARVFSPKTYGFPVRCIKN